MQKSDLKVLLVNPNSGCDLHYAFFPLGLGYVASTLIRDGFTNIKVADFNARHFDQDAFERYLAKERFDVIGMTGLVTAYASIKKLSALIKRVLPESRVILGGGVATAFRDITLKSTSVDMCVASEGESTISQLVNTLYDGGDVTKVNGISYLDSGGKVVATLPRERINDLDAIPFPNHSLFNFEDYLRATPFRTIHKNARIAIMFTSRGCPYSCNYCFLDNWGHQYRYRSPENIIEEIEELRADHGITGVHFVDDVFTVDRERVVVFCEELIRRNIKINWLCSTRVNLVNDGLLALMKRSGCRTICYGIESGSQQILNQMNKKIKATQAGEALEKTWNAGIIPYAFLMIGYFGETEATVRETIEFSVKHGLTGSMSYPTPYPSTELFDQCKAKGLINYTEEWFLENCMDWTENLNLNLTKDIPTEKLAVMKKKAESEIRRRVLVPNMMRYFKVLRTAEFANYCRLRAVEALGRNGHSDYLRHFSEAS